MHLMKPNFSCSLIIGFTSVREHPYNFDAEVKPNSIVSVVSLNSSELVLTKCSACERASANPFLELGHQGLALFQDFAQKILVNYDCEDQIASVFVYLMNSMHTG